MSLIFKDQAVQEEFFKDCVTSQGRRDKVFPNVVITNRRRITSQKCEVLM
jgi:hypothetical protein